MMNKIILIIPYFGKLPNYFQVFLNSCKTTKYLDFLLITDDKSEYTFPSNFKVRYDTLENVHHFFEKRLEKKIYLNHPYKFCDYRPCYGFVFSEDIANYDFWGHCDIDLVFGDIDKYLEMSDLELYDRIYPYGHLSIYKNVNYVNQKFLQKCSISRPKIFDFDFVRKTSYPCNFDEIGMNYIFRRDMNFNEIFYGQNINMHYYNFAVGDGNPPKPQLIVWDNGKLFLYQKDEEITKKEFMYLHMQTINSLPRTDIEGNKFLICRDGILKFDEVDLDFYFTEYGRQSNNILQAERTKFINDKLKKGSKKKITNELLAFPFRGFWNTLQRIKSAKYLASHPLYQY